MKVAIASDHAGYEMKEKIKKFLGNRGYEVMDFGADGEESVDYPDYAHRVSNEILEGNAEYGILLCGSAVGMSIAANRHKGIRCALCWNMKVVELARGHNNANILALPARFISMEMAMQMSEKFINTSFDGGRHERRVGKIEC